MWPFPRLRANLLSIHTAIIIGLWVFPTAAQTVSSISFEGVRRTDTSWLVGFLRQRPGTELNLVEIERDAQRLKRLRLFHWVSYRIVPTEDKDTVYVRWLIREGWYRFPYLWGIWYSGLRGVELGGTDIHLLGKGIRAGFWIKAYQRLSWGVMFDRQILHPRSWGYGAMVQRYRSIEPLYFRPAVVNVDYTLVQFEWNTYYQLSDVWRVGVGISWLYERFDFFQEILGYDTVRTYKNGITLFVVSDQREYDEELVRRGVYEMQIRGIYDWQYPQLGWLQLDMYFTHYWVLPWRVQLIARSGLGIATHRYSPFLPYVIDGQINVRGVGYRVCRGTGVVWSNFEGRRRILETPWFDCLGAIYIDIAGIRDAEGPAWRFFHPSGRYFSSGVGYVFRWKRGWVVSSALYGSLVWGPDGMRFSPVLLVGDWF